MTRQQFGFVIGFLVVLVWAVDGIGTAAAALLAGLAGWTVVRVIDGDVTVAGLAQRPGQERRR